MSSLNLYVLNFCYSYIYLKKIALSVYTIKRITTLFVMKVELIHPQVVEKSSFEFVKYGRDLAFLLDVDLKIDRGTIYYNDRPFFWPGGYYGFEILVGGTRITHKTTLAMPS